MTKMETALASERTHLMARVETAERERDNARAQRDAARAERDDAKEWVHHATRMANERDEAQAERDALAAALEHLERLATTIAADARGLQTLRSGALYDVPPDGQLAQDVHRVTNRTLQPSRYIHEDYNKSREAAARLRAAFGLDEGSE